MSSLRVEKTMKALGRDLKLARKRRRMSIKDFAQRVGTSEATIMRLERGEPGIRMEVFVSALNILGKLGELGQLLDPGKDDQGLMIDQQHLPKRISSGSVTALPRITGKKRSLSPAGQVASFSLHERPTAPRLAKSKAKTKSVQVISPGPSDQNDDGVGF